MKQAPVPKTLEVIGSHQPCKPRVNSTPADRLPMVYRPGSLETNNLPSIQGGWRVWPDGRKERL